MSSVVEGWLWPRMPATVATSRAACDHQAGGGVPEGMDVLQFTWQAVLLEDQLGLRR